MRGLDLARLAFQLAMSLPLLIKDAQARGLGEQIPTIGRCQCSEIVKGPI